MTLRHDVGVELAGVRECAAGLEEDGQGEGVPAAAERAHAAEEAERVGRIREGAEDGIALEGGGEGGRGGEVVVEDGERAVGRQGGGREGEERGGGGGCGGGEGYEARTEEVRVELEEEARGNGRGRGEEGGGDGGGEGGGEGSASETRCRCHGPRDGREAGDLPDSALNFACQR